MDLSLLMNLLNTQNGGGANTNTNTNANSPNFFNNANNMQNGGLGNLGNLFGNGNINLNQILPLLNMFGNKNVNNSTEQKTSPKSEVPVDDEVLKGYIRLE